MFWLLIPLSPHLPTALGFKTLPTIYPLTRLLVLGRETHMKCIDGSKVCDVPNARLLPHDFHESVVSSFSDTGFVRSSITPKVPRFATLSEGRVVSS